MFELLNVTKYRSAYAQPLVARQPAAQTSLASESRDSWYGSCKAPDSSKSVLRCPNGHLTPSSQYDPGDGGGGDGDWGLAVAPWARATSESHRNASAVRDILREAPCSAASCSGSGCNSPALSKRDEKERTRRLWQEG